MLLRLPMSDASRDVAFIPKMWPQERVRVRKSRALMDEEGIGGDDTAVWTTNVVEKYERRPAEMKEVTLAQFVAHYSNRYQKRKEVRVIRYCSYDMKDLENYERERVLLHIPFRSEEVDVLDCNKFMKIYDDNEKLIQERATEFESGLDIDEVIRKAHEMSEERDKSLIATTSAQINTNQATSRLDLSENVTDDDIKTLRLSQFSGIVKKRENVLTNAEYCEPMRMTNFEQRRLIYELIYREIYNGPPLRIFFTGPAGCGKTFTLTQLGETINRLAPHSSIYNSYVACASTGKAAAALNGVTARTRSRWATGTVPCEWIRSRRFGMYFVEYGS